jgi:hypothetical protein
MATEDTKDTEGTAVCDLCVEQFFVG